MCLERVLYDASPFRASRILISSWSGRQEAAPGFVVSSLLSVSGAVYVGLPVRRRQNDARWQAVSATISSRDHSPMLEPAGDDDAHALAGGVWYAQ